MSQLYAHLDYGYDQFESRVSLISVKRGDLEERTIREDNPELARLCRLEPGVDTDIEVIENVTEAYTLSHLKGSPAVRITKGVIQDGGMRIDYPDELYKKEAFEGALKGVFERLNRDKPNGYHPVAVPELEAVLK